MNVLRILKLSIWIQCHFALTSSELTKDRALQIVELTYKDNLPGIMHDIDAYLLSAQGQFAINDGFVRVYDMKPSNSLKSNGNGNDKNDPAQRKYNVTDAMARQYFQNNITVNSLNAKYGKEGTYSLHNSPFALVDLDKYAKETLNYGKNGAKSNNTTDKRRHLELQSSQPAFEWDLDVTGDWSHTYHVMRRMMALNMEQITVNNLGGDGNGMLSYFGRDTPGMSSTLPTSFDKNLGTNPLPNPVGGPSTILMPPKETKQASDSMLAGNSMEFNNGPPAGIKHLEDRVVTDLMPKDMENFQVLPLSPGGPSVEVISSKQSNSATDGNGMNSTSRDSFKPTAPVLPSTELLPPMQQDNKGVGTTGMETLPSNGAVESMDASKEAKRPPKPQADNTSVVTGKTADKVFPETESIQTKVTQLDINDVWNDRMNTKRPPPRDSLEDNFVPTTSSDVGGMQPSNNNGGGGGNMRPSNGGGGTGTWPSNNSGGGGGDMRPSNGGGGGGTGTWPSNSGGGGGGNRVVDVNDNANMNNTGNEGNSSGDTKSAMTGGLDWSTNKCSTSIRNQGRCGACWAFAMIGAVEFAHCIKTEKRVELSDQHWASCDGSPTQRGCNGGALRFDFAVKNQGICSKQEYPYIDENADQISTCKADSCKPLTVSVQSQQQLQANEISFIETLKKQPIAVAVAVEQSWYMYSSGIISNCASANNHAVLLVGHGTLNGQKVWKFKNSWGSQWGINGYGYLKQGSGVDCGIMQDGAIPIMK